MARVVRPDGIVAVFDGDYASLTFDCSDPGLGKAVEAALEAMIMSSSRVMRELPRLLPQAGLRLLVTQANVYAETGSSTFMNIGNRLQAWRLSVRAAGVSAMKKRSKRPRSASCTRLRK